MTVPQQLPPADEFYLAAHDGIGGRALLPRQVLGVGLGAALLGELMFWRRVELAGDALRVIDDRPTGDQATATLLGMLRRPSVPLGPREWITHLSSVIAPSLIEQRLTNAGVLRRETKRRLFGGGEVSLVFADPRTPGEPANRIRTHLSYNQDLDTADLMLAGLILATGLDEMVLDTINPRDRARLNDQFRRHLPHPLHQLVAHARASTAVSA
ncbi:GPP34 family phosphoprotein [Actinoplanes sp. NPDC051861]|uniref:GOLPH3/VPS74 family protein n=1 Tax=Actinoplanes sp. NPDC051861 TaxID=3155170 RepID=UPI00342E4B68